MLDPAMLRLLALIDATGSLAGAADELGLTPAGVTQQVARMERQVGGPVVIRGPRGARLAPVGLVLAEHGRRVDEATRDADRALSRALGRMQEQLRVGSLRAAVLHVVAPALTALRHRHVHPDLDLIDIESARAVDLVAADRLDIAVISAFDEAAPIPRELAAHYLLDDPLVLVLPVEHPVARDTAPDELVHLSSLHQDAWIAILAGGAARRQFDRVAEQSGITPDIRFQTGSFDVAQALVGTGVAVAVVSRLALRELPGTTYRPIVTDGAARRIEAVTRRDLPFTPLVDEFLGLLRDVAEDLVSSWRP
jgi:molybdate transport repressor ModE-like protein